MERFNEEILTSGTFRFVVEGEVVTLHRGLVSRYSEPLAALMTGGLCESANGEAIVDDVDYETFVRFGAWLYGGTYQAAEMACRPSTESQPSENAPVENAEDEAMQDADEPDADELDAVSETAGIAAQETSLNDPPAESDPAVQSSTSPPSEIIGMIKVSRGENEVAKWLIEGKPEGPDEEELAETDEEEEMAEEEEERNFIWGLREEQQGRASVILRRRFLELGLEGDVEHKIWTYPKENLRPADDCSPVFLSHARLYAFAEKWQVDGLKEVVLDQLFHALAGLIVWQESIQDILVLTKFVYANTSVGTDATGKKQEPLRWLLARYIASEMDTLFEDDRFRTLMAENREFFGDMVECLQERLVEFDIRHPDTYHNDDITTICFWPAARLLASRVRDGAPESS